MGSSICEKKWKGWERWRKHNPTKREHYWKTREASWCESVMFHENPKDGRKGKISAETSWDCILDQFEDVIPVS